MRTALLGVSIVLMLSGCGQERPAPIAMTSSRAAAEANALQGVATVKQVMQGITIPASNTVFAVAGIAPADDAGWEAVEASALAVAESGNLLLMKPRAVDDQEWKQFSLALIEAGERAAAAARSKDADQASTAGDDMYTVCEQCHAKYMPKA